MHHAGKHMRVWTMDANEIKNGLNQNDDDDDDNNENDADNISSLVLAGILGSG